MEGEKSGSMNRFGWPNRLVLLCVFATFLFAELIRWLGLVPVVLLIPWKVAIGAIVVLVAIVGFVFVWLRRRGWKFQFSTRMLLLVAVMIAWSLSRFAMEATLERNRIRAQDACFQLAQKLTPLPKQLSLAYRYNQGEGTIHRLLIGLLAPLVNQNEIRFEIAYISAMDLSGTDITDEQLSIVAKTGTVSELNLSSTNITDAGLENLYGLQSLKSITLTNTSVSMAAIAALKKRLPELVVVP